MDLHAKQISSCLILYILKQSMSVLEHFKVPQGIVSVEANEPPLSLRRTKLTLQYCLKLMSNPANPVYSCVCQPKLQDGFEGNPER